MPRAQRRRVSKRLRRRRRLVISLATVLALIVLIGAGSYLYIRYRFGQIGHVSVGGLTAQSSGPENILLVGNNSRCTLTKYSSFYSKGSQHFGTCSEVGGGRSDVTMVLHVDPATHRAYLLSIPRDLWLPMPNGNGLELRVDDALNSAERPYLHLPFGPTLLVKTIEQDLGIPINHYVELNFYTFEQVVNTLGGVTLDFPTKLVDHYSGLNITTTGCQHLTGTQALALVRARHLYYYNPSTGTWDYDGTGDLGRIVRTHIFLRALASQVKSSALSNPITANALLGSLLPALKVDPSFSLSDMVSLALAFRHVNPGSIPSATLPVIIPSQSTFTDPANPSNYQAPGSIVMPWAQSDLSVIRQFLGSEAPNLNAIRPASVTVAVRDASGVGNGSQLVAGLSQLGFPTTNLGTATYAGTDSETVVAYKPGMLAQGERVLASLSGQAVLAEGSANQPADVVITAGSTIATTATSAQTAALTTTSAPTATLTATSTTTPPVGTLVTSTQSLQQLASSNLWQANASGSEFWWDPRLCPAHA
ncbi:LCP family protein [Acidimicrobium ferrooxidans]|nr:LCP family protein [Acidimicrobium ferrooxidans]